VTGTVEGQNIFGKVAIEEGHLKKKVLLLSQQM
jgi:hypothetical protein